MAKIKLTNKQLKLIQNALEMYSRIGILQLDNIIEHPTIDHVIRKQFTEEKKLEIGDETMRGEIVEINKEYIKTKGHWGNGEEIKTWTDIDKIKLSPDWDKIHDTRDKIKNYLNTISCLISGENHSQGVSYGIHSKEVDESCREAFDIIQIIRHEFWKKDPTKSMITVDSNVNLTSLKPNIVSVELDTIKEIRKQKLDNLK